MSASSGGLSERPGMSKKTGCSMTAAAAEEEDAMDGMEWEGGGGE